MQMPHKHGYWIIGWDSFPLPFLEAVLSKFSWHFYRLGKVLPGWKYSDFSLFFLFFCFLCKMFTGTVKRIHLEYFIWIVNVFLEGRIGKETCVEEPSMHGELSEGLHGAVLVFYDPKSKVLRGQFRINLVDVSEHGEGGWSGHIPRGSRQKCLPELGANHDCQV